MLPVSADVGAVLGFDAFVPVPDQVGFEVVGEFVDALVLVVQVVVELLFEAAEEALGGGVVGRAALGAHGPCQPVPFADRDPFGCFASMSFQQAHQYFSAVWADGFPRSRHHAVSDVR